VLVYRAISIWIPGAGGLFAWLSARRAGAIPRRTLRPAAAGGFRLAEATKTEA